MKSAQTFWDKIAPRYAKSPIKHQKVYQEKLRITQEYFSPESTVLEFGCGTGSTAVHHAPFVKHILAMDISTAMLNIAREKAEAAKTDNITFEHGDIGKLAVDVHNFDVVLGLSILHLLQDKQAVINHVFKILKPGGVFISSTVCVGDGLWFWRLVLPVVYRLGITPYVDIFTETALAGDIKASGFTIERQWKPGKGQAVFIVAKKPLQ